MCQYPPVVTDTIAKGPAYACCSSHVLHWLHTSSHGSATLSSPGCVVIMQGEDNDDHVDDDDDCWV